VHRLLRDLMALLLIYGNVAVGLQPHALRKLGVRVPRPGFVHDAFLITGMFGSYTDVNGDFFIFGLRDERGATHDRGRWIQLAVHEHFPQRHGVVFTELFAAHHWDTHGRPAQRRAWTFLARKIREHHNRLHPERSVARIRFGTQLWPLSPHGYRAGKRPGAIRQQTWFAESGAP
jgi:hypothetical protein